MQVLDSYLAIDDMLSTLEKQVRDNELDAAQRQLAELDNALKVFCDMYLVESSGVVFESAVKLNERFIKFIAHLEVAKKKTAKVLIGQVSNRKKISAYRNT